MLRRFFSGYSGFHSSLKPTQIIGQLRATSLSVSIFLSRVTLHYGIIILVLQKHGKIFENPQDGYFMKVSSILWISPIQQYGFSDLHTICNFPSYGSIKFLSKIKIYSTSKKCPYNFHSMDFQISFQSIAKKMR